jgi:hypothetical protein
MRGQHSQAVGLPLLSLRPQTPRWSPGRTIVVLAIVLGLVAVTVWWRVTTAKPPTLNMIAGLPRDGVVAADVGAPQSRGQWTVTSGSLFTRDGALWSGVPDAGPPDPAHGRTGSAVLRAVSTRRDFRNVHVHLNLRLQGLSTTSRTRAQDWDGVHLFLRYRSPNDLYVLDLVRRDGTLTIKRKIPPTPGLASSQTAGSEPGTYVQLAATRAVLAPGEHVFDASIRDRGKGVQISLAIDGRTLLSTTDLESTAIHSAGGVGLRGDNAEFTASALTVTATR